MKALFPKRDITSDRKYLREWGPNIWLGRHEDEMMLMTRYTIFPAERFEDVFRYFNLSLDEEDAFEFDGATGGLARSGFVGKLPNPSHLMFRSDTLKPVVRYENLPALVVTGSGPAVVIGDGDRVCALLLDHIRAMVGRRAWSMDDLKFYVNATPGDPDLPSPMRTSWNLKPVLVYADPMRLSVRNTTQPDIFLGLVMPVRFA